MASSGSRVARLIPLLTKCAPRRAASTAGSRSMPASRPGAQKRVNSPIQSKPQEILASS